MEENGHGNYSQIPNHKIDDSHDALLPRVQTRTVTSF